MQSLFKTEKVKIDGVELTVRELSAGDNLEIAGKDGMELIEIVCSRCVAEWSGETAETIRANVPARIMREITEKAFTLSGMDAAKNSEATPAAGSSTA